MRIDHVPSLFVSDVNVDGSKHDKKIAIILTPGRSGSSLLMQIMSAFGMRLSENLVLATDENPDGYFEDAELVALHNKYFKLFGMQSYLPAPSTFNPSHEAHKFEQELSKLLKNNVYTDVRLWGVKDPKISSFFPIWKAELKRNKLVPLFILAIRDPAVTLRSFITYYPHTSNDCAELIWLTRVCDALHYTRGNCYIVHYEDWFRYPVETVQNLLQFTGLEHSFTGDIADKLSSIIKPSLNPSIHEEYTVHNKRISMMYEALKECRGICWERKNLMRLVMDCRNAMQEFSFYFQEISNLDRRIRKLTASNEEQKIWQIDNNKLQLELSTLQKNHKIALEVVSSAHVKKNEKIVAEWNKKYDTVLADVEKLILLNSGYINEISTQNNTIEELRIKVTSLQAALQEAQKYVEVRKNKASSRAAQKTTPLVGVAGQQASPTVIQKTGTMLTVGSASHVKQLLPYRLGTILADKSESFIGSLSLPFALLSQYRKYRKEEKQRGNAPLPVLADFADAHEGRALCNTLPFKLGKAFIDNISSPLDWLRLPLVLKKVRQECQATTMAKNE